MTYSTPHLFALARGQDCTGDNQCFYCAARCDERFAAKEFVKDSFTGRNESPCPGSAFVCAGCVLCLGEGVELTTLDGVHRTNQKPRGYSWLIQAHQARAATKANLAVLREFCLNPPAAPFSIVLSDSGQKHLLYRCPVNRDAGSVSLLLETERIDYLPAQLAERLALCKPICAASGKPALREPPNMRFGMAVFEACGEAVLNQWSSVWSQPLSRLAAWLCPPKEACQNDPGY
jgi:hypothetical protein